MVTATTVEADPMGVMFPPRLELNITLHQNPGVWLYPVPGKVFKIFPSIADNGILSVTALRLDTLTQSDMHTVLLLGRSQTRLNLTGF